jgi:hypothetical protein
MTTYTAISNTLVAVGAKPFASTIQALRDNPIAIAEGDDNAPRITGDAAGRDSTTAARNLPVATVSAGDVFSSQGQGLVLGTTSTSSTSNVVLATFTIRSYSGTLRFTASHSVSDATRTSTLEIYKNNTLVQAYTTSSIFAQSRVNDVSIAVGDVIEWRHRISNSDSTSNAGLTSSGVSADDPWVTQAFFRRHFKS